MNRCHLINVFKMHQESYSNRPRATNEQNLLQILRLWNIFLRISHLLWKNFIFNGKVRNCFERKARRSFCRNGISSLPEQKSFGSCKERSSWPKQNISAFKTLRTDNYWFLCEIHIFKWFLLPIFDLLHKIDQFWEKWGVLKHHNMNSWGGTQASLLF